MDSQCRKRNSEDENDGVKVVSTVLKHDLMAVNCCYCKEVEEVYWECRETPSGVSLYDVSTGRKVKLVFPCEKQMRTLERRRSV